MLGMGYMALDLYCDIIKSMCGNDMHCDRLFFIYVRISA